MKIFCTAFPISRADSLALSSNARALYPASCKTVLAILRFPPPHNGVICSEETRSTGHLLVTRHGYFAFCWHQLSVPFFSALKNQAMPLEVELPIKLQVLAPVAFWVFASPCVTVAHQAPVCGIVQEHWVGSYSGFSRDLSSTSDLPRLYADSATLTPAP